MTDGKADRSMGSAQAPFGRSEPQPVAGGGEEETCRKLVNQLRVEGPFNQCGGDTDGHPDPGDLMILAALAIEALLSFPRVERERKIADKGMELIRAINKHDIGKDLRGQAYTDIVGAKNLLADAIHALSLQVE